MQAGDTAGGESLITGYCADAAAEERFTVLVQFHRCQLTVPPVQHKFLPGQVAGYTESYAEARSAIVAYHSTSARLSGVKCGEKYLHHNL